MSMSQENGLVKRDGTLSALITRDDLIALFWMPAQSLEATSPKYLPLPDVIGSLASHRLYVAARPFGRLQYREEMYELDESGTSVIYWPVEYSRDEVLAVVNELLRPVDMQTALLPLPWRVGWLVGWLSGLAIAQRDDAQVGMVLLAMLVAPLLSQPVAQASTSARRLDRIRKNKRG